MKQLEYQVSFTTPAFLGNAQQQAQWRTPPFKALIRQWWRVLQQAVARNDYVSMRQREGRLFGNAWLTDEQERPLHSKSDVRLRIEPTWAEGNLLSDKWPGGPVDHVATTRDGRNTVRADVYLGYGPVLPESRREGRTQVQIPRGAISTEQHADLRVTCPEHSVSELFDTLAVANWFGTLGSRSHNGWGSVAISATRQTPPLPAFEPAAVLLRTITRPWDQCLQLDWPHAIGARDDGRPLVWMTEDFDDWRKVIGRLANVRVAVRQAAKRIRGEGCVAGAIHFLGYPAGTGPTNSWSIPLSDRSKEPRLASPLRFKIIRAPDGKRVRGMVFHMPCRIPDAFLESLRDERDRRWLGAHENQKQAWVAVHGVLNNDSRLKPLEG